MRKCEGGPVSSAHGRTGSSRGEAGQGGPEGSTSFGEARPSAAGGSTVV